MTKINFLHAQKLTWLIGCLIFLKSCNGPEVPKAFTVASFEQNKNLKANLLQIDSVKKLIQSSDIITRTGNDFTSQSLKTLNRTDKTFSHCGIASKENDSLFVYHALGGEWNPDQKLKRELFENFVNPVNNNLLGVYRFNMKESEKIYTVKISQLLYKKHMEFDMDFDLKTDEKMYCAEFVYKVLLHSADSTFNFKHSFIEGFEFIGIDDIVNNPSSKKIAVVNYRLY